MDLSEFMNLPKKYRRHLTFQQFSTLKGQAKAGDIDATFKGLKKLLHRRATSGMPLLLVSLADTRD